MEYNFNIVGYLKELLPSTNLYIDVIERLGKTIADNNIYVWIDYLSRHELESGVASSIWCTGDMERLSLKHTKELINIMAIFEVEREIDSKFLVELAIFGCGYICDKILEILQEIADEIEEEKRERIS